MIRIARALSFTLLTVASAEGRFSILMPDKADAGNFDVQVGSVKVTAHVFIALSHPIFVMCGYYDFPSA